MSDWKPDEEFMPQSKPILPEELVNYIDEVCWVCQACQGNGFNDPPVRPEAQSLNNCRLVKDLKQVYAMGQQSVLETCQKVTKDLKEEIARLKPKEVK